MSCLLVCKRLCVALRDFVTQTPPWRSWPFPCAHLAPRALHVAADTDAADRSAERGEPSARVREAREKPARLRRLGRLFRALATRTPLLLQVRGLLRTRRVRRRGDSSASDAPIHAATLHTSGAQAFRRLCDEFRNCSMTYLME